MIMKISDIINHKSQSQALNKISLRLAEQGNQNFLATNFLAEQNAVDPGRKNFRMTKKEHVF